MITERGVKYKNTRTFIIISPIFVVMVGVAVYLFLKVGVGAFLICLLGFIGLIVFMLFQPTSVAVSRLGVSQDSILRSWDVAWRDITGWNEVVIEKRVKRTIWFRTGATIYKISPDFFIVNDLEIFKTYFEKHCGKPLEGENRLRLSLFN